MKRKFILLGLCLVSAFSVTYANEEETQTASTSQEQISTDSQDKTTANAEKDTKESSCSTCKKG